MKIYFSVHAGDSLSHVLRTVEVAQELQDRGHKVLYGSSPWTQEYVKAFELDFTSTNQKVGHTDLAKRSGVEEIDLLAEMVKRESQIISYFKPDLVVADPGIAASLFDRELPKVRVLHGIYLHLNSPNSCFDGTTKRNVRLEIERVVNAVAEKTGLNPIFKYEDLFSGKVVVPGIKEFEIRGEYPNATFVGPMVMGEVGPEGDSSVGYITLGTGNKDGKLLNRLLESTRGRFSKTYVSIGRWLDCDLDTEGHNMQAERLFNGMPKDAGIVICHGGHGTVYQALCSGKRIVAVPYNLDQLVQGQNLERTFTGVQVDGRSKGMLFEADLEDLAQSVELATKLESPDLRMDRVNDIEYFADVIEGN